MAEKKKTKKVNRSAEDGEFVSKEEAKKNPKGTVTDTVPAGKVVKADSIKIATSKENAEAGKAVEIISAPSTEDGLTPEQPEASASFEPVERYCALCGWEGSTDKPEGPCPKCGEADSLNIPGPDFAAAEEPLQVENPEPVAVPDPRFEEAARIAREDWEAGQDQRDAEAAREAYEAEQLAIAKEAEAAELAALAEAEETEEIG